MEAGTLPRLRRLERAEARERRGEGLPPVQLYDMAADLGERDQRPDDHPEIVARLTKLLEKYVADGRSTPAGR